MKLPHAAALEAARGGWAVSVGASSSCSVPLPMHGRWQPRRGAFLGAIGPQLMVHGVTRKHSATPPQLQEMYCRPASLPSVAEGV